MKAIILSDMDKLLSPIEQAQKLGIIKTQIQMKSNEKQNYISIGIIVTCVVILGGSFLCNASYCASYRVSSRMATDPSTSLEHLGFRTVATPEMVNVK